MDAESIRDIFQGIGPVQIRRMFGGQGVYRDGMMFALEAGGELYLKADQSSQDMFRDRGSRPFAYTTRDGRITIMSYWLMPESALDDPEEAAVLARLALAAAQRSRAAPKKTSKKKGGTAVPPRHARKAG